MKDKVVLQAKGLTKHFPRRNGETVTAVSNVSLSLRRAETLALVGESGSGKTTVGLMVAGLLPPSAGQVRLFGQLDPFSLRGGAARALRRHLQWIPQMPSASLNPDATVYRTLAEPLRAHGIVTRRSEIRRYAANLLAKVGLDQPGILGRRTRQMSIGQQQRLAIARSLSVQPEILICDEVTSGLDACIQVQTVALLKRIQEENGIAMLFITHNLALARWIANRTIVMRQGRIVEEGETEALMRFPKKAYTKALLDAVALSEA